MSQDKWKPSAILGYALACGGVLFATFIILALIKVPDEGQPDRMVRECDRLFPYSEDAKNRCVLELMVRRTNEYRRDQMESAYQRSR